MNSGLCADVGWRFHRDVHLVCLSCLVILTVDGKCVLVSDKRSGYSCLRQEAKDLCPSNQVDVIFLLSSHEY